MSSASFGIRASVPFQNPPGVPADVIPILGGTKADIEWEVIQNNVFTPATVAIGPWDKGGGLLVYRVSNAGTSSVTFRTKPISAPFVQARLIPGTTVYVVFFDLFASGTLNQYLAYPFSFAATTGGGGNKGAVVTSPSDTLIGSPPGPRQFTFVITGPGADTQFMRWNLLLENSFDYRTTFMRLGYIGYSWP